MGPCRSPGRRPDQRRVHLSRSESLLLQGHAHSESALLLCSAAPPQVRNFNNFESSNSHLPTVPSFIISRLQRLRCYRPYLRPSLPAMPSYYTYDERYPSTLNDPDAPATVQWEDSRGWPRTYTVTRPNAEYQGYHPPAPVYQSSQPAQYQQYYYGQAVSTPSSK